jgi:hypothetical protein
VPEKKNNNKKTSTNKHKKKPHPNEAVTMRTFEWRVVGVFVLHHSAVVAILHPEHARHHCSDYSKKALQI